MNKKNQRVAIVHDWLYGGGAELVVEQLHKMYPDAPIYTSYCSDEWRERLGGKVITGYLQHWPFSKLRKFLPVLRQWWFKKLNLSEFELVISSSGNGEAKFIQKRSDATHICYCHSPTHFYWRKYDEYLKSPGFRPKWLVRLGLRLMVKPLRKRDYIAAQGVDYFIANSSHIQNDIKKYYGRESTVIHPPVDIGKWQVENGRDGKPRNGFITWGRHIPYKRFDLAIEACNQLGLDLVIAGAGPETSKLQKIAGPTITFTGFLNQEQLVEQASKATAFVFPTDEDFGIAPIEAMALGLPIIAFESGGALDYVREGETGIFFQKQTVASLKSAIKRFQKQKFIPATTTKTVTKFSDQQFQSKIKSFIESTR